MIPPRSGLRLKVCVRDPRTDRRLPPIQVTVTQALMFSWVSNTKAMAILFTLHHLRKGRPE